MGFNSNSFDNQSRTGNHPRLGWIFYSTPINGRVITPDSFTTEQDGSSLPTQSDFYIMPKEGSSLPTHRQPSWHGDQIRLMWICFCFDKWNTRFGFGKINRFVSKHISVHTGNNMRQDLSLSQVTLINKAIKEPIEPIEMGFTNLKTAHVCKFLIQKTILNEQLTGKIQI